MSIELNPNIKLCECGCGLPTNLAPAAVRGYKKGEPYRYLHGHRPWTVEQKTKMSHFHGTPLERFEGKVNKNGPVVKAELGPCWLWMGAMDKSTGYGAMGFYGKTERTHIVAFKLFKGDIPYGLEIDHLCRIRLCVNPDHLDAVTQQVNLMRGMGPAAVNARKTHCKNGHEFTGENTYHLSNGSRCCRACQLAIKAAERRAEGVPEKSSTHCKRGHEYATASIYVNPRTGKKHCLDCRRMWRAENREQINRARKDKRWQAKRLSN